MQQDVRPSANGRHDPSPGGMLQQDGSGRYSATAPPAANLGPRQEYHPDQGSPDPWASHTAAGVFQPYAVQTRRSVSEEAVEAMLPNVWNRVVPSFFSSGPQAASSHGQEYGAPVAAVQVNPRAPMPSTNVPSAAPAGVQHLAPQWLAQNPPPLNAAYMQMQGQCLSQHPAHLPGRHIAPPPANQMMQAFPPPANQMMQPPMDETQQLIQTLYQNLARHGPGAAVQHDVLQHALRLLITALPDIQPGLNGPSVGNPAYMQMGVAHPHHQAMAQMGHGGIVPGGNVGVPQMPGHVLPGAGFGPGSGYSPAPVPAGFGAGIPGWRPNHGPGTGYPPLDYGAGNLQPPAFMGGVGPPQANGGACPQAVADIANMPGMQDFISELRKPETLAQIRVGVVPPYLLEILPPYLQKLMESYPDTFPAHPVSGERAKRKRSDSEQDVVTDCIDLTQDTPPGTPTLQPDDEEEPMESPPDGPSAAGERQSNPPEKQPPALPGDPGWSAPLTGGPPQDQQSSPGLLMDPSLQSLATVAMATDTCDLPPFLGGPVPVQRSSSGHQLAALGPSPRTMAMPQDQAQPSAAPPSLPDDQTLRGRGPSQGIGPVPVQCGSSGHQLAALGPSPRATAMPQDQAQPSAAPPSLPDDQALRGRGPSQGNGVPVPLHSSSSGHRLAALVPSLRTMATPQDQAQPSAAPPSLPDDQSLRGRGPSQGFGRPPSSGAPLATHGVETHGATNGGNSADVPPEINPAGRAGSLPGGASVARRGLDGDCSVDMQARQKSQPRTGQEQGSRKRRAVSPGGVRNKSARLDSEHRPAKRAREGHPQQKWGRTGYASPGSSSATSSDDDVPMRQAGRGKSSRGSNLGGRSTGRGRELSPFPKRPMGMLGKGGRGQSQNLAGVHRPFFGLPHGFGPKVSKPGHERSPAQGLGGTRFGVHNPRSGGGKHDQPFPDELQDHEGGAGKPLHGPCAVCCATLGLEWFRGPEKLPVLCPTCHNVYKRAVRQGIQFEMKSREEATRIIRPSMKARKRMDSQWAGASGALTHQVPGRGPGHLWGPRLPSGNSKPAGKSQTGKERPDMQQRQGPPSGTGKPTGKSNTGNERTDMQQRQGPPPFKAASPLAPRQAALPRSPPITRPTQTKGARGPVAASHRPMGHSSASTAGAGVDISMGVAKVMATEARGVRQNQRLAEKQAATAVPLRVVAKQHAGSLKIAHHKPGGGRAVQNRSPDEQTVHRLVMRVFNNVVGKAGEKPREVRAPLQVRNVVGLFKDHKAAGSEPVHSADKNGEDTWNSDKVTRPPTSRPPSAPNNRPRKPRDQTDMMVSLLRGDDADTENVEELPKGFQLSKLWDMVETAHLQMHRSEAAKKKPALIFGLFQSDVQKALLKTGRRGKRLSARIRVALPPSGPIENAKGGKEQPVPLAMISPNEMAGQQLRPPMGMTAGKTTEMPTSAHMPASKPPACPSPGVPDAKEDPGENVRRRGRPRKADSTRRGRPRKAESALSTVSHSRGPKQVASRAAQVREDALASIRKGPRTLSGCRGRGMAGARGRGRTRFHLADDRERDVKASPAIEPGGSPLGRDGAGEEARRSASMVSGPQDVNQRTDPAVQASGMVGGLPGQSAMMPLEKCTANLPSGAPEPGPHTAGIANLEESMQTGNKGLPHIASLEESMQTGNKGLPHIGPLHHAPSPPMQGGVAHGQGQGPIRGAGEEGPKPMLTDAATGTGVGLGKGTTMTGGGSAAIAQGGPAGPFLHSGVGPQTNKDSGSSSVVTVAAHMQAVPKGLAHGLARSSMSGSASAAGKSNPSQATKNIQGRLAVGVKRGVGDAVLPAQLPLSTAGSTAAIAGGMPAVPPLQSGVGANTAHGTGSAAAGPPASLQGFVTSSTSPGMSRTLGNSSGAGTTGHHIASKGTLPSSSVTGKQDGIRQRAQRSDCGMPRPRATKKYKLEVAARREHATKAQAAIKQRDEVQGKAATLKSAQRGPGLAMPPGSATPMLFLVSTAPVLSSASAPPVPSFPLPPTGAMPVPTPLDKLPASMTQAGEAPRWPPAPRIRPPHAGKPPGSRLPLPFLGGASAAASKPGLVPPHTPSAGPPHVATSAVPPQRLLTALANGVGPSLAAAAGPSHVATLAVPPQFLRTALTKVVGPSLAAAAATPGSASGRIQPTPGGQQHASATGGPPLVSNTLPSTSTPSPQGPPPLPPGSLPSTSTASPQGLPPLPPGSLPSTSTQSPQGLPPLLPGILPSTSTPSPQGPPPLQPGTSRTTVPQLKRRRLSADGSGVSEDPDVRRVQLGLRTLSAKSPCPASSPRNTGSLPPSSPPAIVSAMGQKTPTPNSDGSGLRKAEPQGTLGPALESSPRVSAGTLPAGVPRAAPVVAASGPEPPASGPASVPEDPLRVSHNPDIRKVQLGLRAPCATGPHPAGAVQVGQGLVPPSPPPTRAPTPGPAPAPAPAPAPHPATPDSFPRHGILHGPDPRCHRAGQRFVNILQTFYNK